MLRTLSKIYNRIASALTRLWEWVRWRMRTQELQFRIRVWAGGRYKAVQPLLTKPEDYETFVRFGHMEITVTAGGTALEGVNAAPVARRLWDRGQLFGADPEMEYDLLGGETVRDPGHVEPGTAIDEIRMQGSVRVPSDFLR